MRFIGCQVLLRQIDTGIVHPSASMALTGSIEVIDTNERRIESDTMITILSREIHIRAEMTSASITYECKTLIILFFNFARYSENCF
jgi:hypothetical protein